MLPLLIKYKFKIFTILLIAISIPSLCAKEADKTNIQTSASASYTRTFAKYNIPDVQLMRKDGKGVSLTKELNDGRPVAVNFIFTTCGAICPMLSHLFSVVEDKLTKKQVKFHLISISIDPEADSPAKLVEYANKFHAGANWDHYTGSLKDSLTVQKAFNVFRGDKMKHASVILLRSTPNTPWLRLEGFMSPDNIISEMRDLNSEH